MNRTLDSILALIGATLLVVPMVVVALLVKITSKGPVFFRQNRIGFNGREFQVLKFRSMKIGSDFRQAVKGDDRLTPIGGVLRRTSLDELPQLFNVLTGDMSLVGPRPHATAQDEFYSSQIEGYSLRQNVRPGITGLAQVSGYRGETETLYKMKKRIDYDNQYIQDKSLWLDLKIIVQTFFVVLSMENAY